MKSVSFDDVMTLAGRVLIAVLFVPSALGKVFAFGGVTMALGAKGLPAPELFAAGAVALELAASAAIVAGWQVRWSALALGVYSIVAAALFHNFWSVPEAMAMAQRQAFFKNVGLLGGLLVLAARGPGAIALSRPSQP